MPSPRNAGGFSVHLKAQVPIRNINVFPFVEKSRHALITVRYAGWNAPAADYLQVKLTEDGRRKVVPVRCHDDVDLLAPLGKNVVLTTWNRCHIPTPSEAAVALVRTTNG